MKQLRHHLFAAMLAFSLAACASGLKISGSDRFNLLPPTYEHSAPLQAVQVQDQRDADKKLSRERDDGMVLADDRFNRSVAGTISRYLSGKITRSLSDKSLDLHRFEIVLSDIKGSSTKYRDHDRLMGGMNGALGSLVAAAMDEVSNRMSRFYLASATVIVQFNDEAITASGAESYKGAEDREAAVSKAFIRALDNLANDIDGRVAKTAQDASLNAGKSESGEQKAGTTGATGATSNGN